MVVVTLSTYAGTAVEQSVVEHHIEATTFRIPVVTDAYIALKRLAEAGIDDIGIGFFPIGRCYPIFARTAGSLIGVDFQFHTGAYGAASGVVDYGLHIGERSIIVAVNRS